MILGYLWLNSFSRFQYDHTAAAVSALVSAVTFSIACTTDNLADQNAIHDVGAGI